MPSPSSANLQAAAFLALNATAANSTNVVKVVDEEGWQVVVPRTRNKKSTTSALPAESPTAQNTNAGNKKPGLKENKPFRSAKGFGGEMRRTPVASSQPLTSSKTRPSLTFMQVITDAAPVEPQESTLENNIGNRDSALKLLVPQQTSIQLDSQTGSQASSSDKEVVDFSSPVSLSVQSRVAVPDDDVPHESVPADVAGVTCEIVEGSEATVLVEAVSVDDEDHKTEAVKLTRPSSLPSSAEAGPEERTIIETAALAQSRSTEITITGSSVVIECENLDYGMSTVEEAKSVRKNASEGGAEGNIDAAKRRLSPPFQWNHVVVPIEEVFIGVPAVTNWTPFMHLYSFPPVVGEPIYQVGTPMTMMRSQSKLNPYAQEFLPSYIKDQSPSFGIMATQHCRVTSTDTVVAAPLNSRGCHRVDTTQSTSCADNNNNNNFNGSEGQMGRQTQGIQSKQRLRNRQRGGGPSNPSLGDFFRS